MCAFRVYCAINENAVLIVLVRKQQALSGPSLPRSCEVSSLRHGLVEAARCTSDEKPCVDVGGRARGVRQAGRILRHDSKLTVIITKQDMISRI